MWSFFTNFEQCWHQQKKPVKLYETEETTHQAKKNNKFCKLFFCYYFLFGLWFFFPFVCHIWIPLNKHKKECTTKTQQMLTNFHVTTTDHHTALCRSFIFIMFSISSSHFILLIVFHLFEFACLCIVVQLMQTIAALHTHSKLCSSSSTASRRHHCVLYIYHYRIDYGKSAFKHLTERAFPHTA